LSKTELSNFSIKGAKIEGRYFLRLFPRVYNAKLIDKWLRVINYPKTIVVFVKFAFLMEILNLVENKSECIRYDITKRLGATFGRRHNESSSRWSVVHFRHPIHYWYCLLFFVKC